MILPFNGLNWQVVYAGDAALHEPMLIKLPFFVAIGTVPEARIVMPFIGKTNGYSIAVKRPHFFDEPVIQFLVPLSSEKLDVASSVIVFIKWVFASVSATRSF